MSGQGGLSTIWSVNEWGRLCEVILGSPRGAIVPSMDDISQQSFDRFSEAETAAIQTMPMPQWVIDETLEDVAELETVLKSHGVRVLRSEHLDSTKTVSTPYWQTQQESSINIRDMTLILGDMIIEAPSPTRGRYAESFAVRDLFDDYRRRCNTAWFVAPHRPRLMDGTYDLSRDIGINETEPLFDAANFVRLGRDIVMDVNNTANRAGADWVQLALDKHFGMRVVNVHCVALSPDHMDVIIVPLCEGCALINPQYVSADKLPSCMASWDLILAPEMVSQSFHTGAAKASNWIGMNLLVLDGEQKTVIIEQRQTSLIRILEQNGFQPVPVRWRHGRTWGGGFHCVTLDVHRVGGL